MINGKLAWETKQYQVVFFTESIITTSGNNNIIFQIRMDIDSPFIRKIHKLKPLNQVIHIQDKAKKALFMTRMKSLLVRNIYYSHFIFFK